MNNFKKLFFVLSFSFVFTLVFAPIIVSAQTGTCTDFGYCAGKDALGCASVGGCAFVQGACQPSPPCASRTATNCSPACDWTPTGSGVNDTLPGDTGQNPPPSSNLKLDNPLGTDSINTLIGRVINSIMGIVGSLALLMFVYGGLVWMTSSGSQDKVKKGKDILLWSAVGLIVIFGAYAITKFIISLAT